MCLLSVDDLTSSPKMVPKSLSPHRIPRLNTVADGERTHMFKAQQSACHSHWRVKPGLLHQPSLGAIWEPCCCDVQLRKNECSVRVFVSC